MKCRLAKRRDGLWTLTDHFGTTMSSYSWLALWNYVWWGIDPSHPMTYKMYR